MLMYVLAFAAIIAAFVSYGLCKDEGLITLVNFLKTFAVMFPVITVIMFFIAMAL